MAIYAQAKPAGTPTWIDLSSSDVEASRTFYHTLFGWEYDIGGPEFGGYSTARSGSHQVAGLVGFPPGQVLPVMWGLYFASDDIEADTARATELGATLVYPAMKAGNFGTMVVLNDPTGAPFCFWQADTHIGFEVTDQPSSPTWFELYASDIKRARDFYAALLNATVEPMPGDMEYYILKHGDLDLCGIMQLETSEGDVGSHWDIYFAVANADDSAATVTAQGGQVLSTLEDTPFGRMASVADPQGAAFKIIQPSGL